MFCGARGHPTPTIQWVTLGSEGGLPSASVMDLPGLRRMQSDGTLVFEPFRAELYRQDVHNAVYRCTASNRFGVVGSRDVHVRAGEFHLHPFITLPGVLVQVVCLVMGPETFFSNWSV